MGYSLDKRDALYKEATKTVIRKSFWKRPVWLLPTTTEESMTVFAAVIFPVHTLSGKVVAFGGRVLKKDEKTAKYVNSPESEILP